MQMNIKSLTSSIGLLIIAIALIFSVAVISMLPSLRIDLTEDKLYTLSEGTRNIVANFFTQIAQPKMCLKYVVMEHESRNY